MKITWSEIEGDKDDLCGRYRDRWVDVVYNSNNYWSTYFNNKHLRDFSFRDEAQKWLEDLANKNELEFA